MHGTILIFVAILLHLTLSASHTLGDLPDEIQRQAYPGHIIFDENFNAKSDG